MFKCVTGIVGKLFKKRAEFKIEYSFVEKEIIWKLNECVTESVSEFNTYIKDRGAYCQLKDQYIAKATTLIFCLEKHLYTNIGNRIRLGNTSICGGSIQTLEKSADKMRFPRARYRIQLPMIGSVYVTISSRILKQSEQETIVAPIINIDINAFDHLQHHPSVCYTINKKIDDTLVGWVPNLRK